MCPFLLLYLVCVELWWLIGWVGELSGPWLCEPGAVDTGVWCTPPRVLCLPCLSRMVSVCTADITRQGEAQSYPSAIGTGIVPRISEGSYLLSGGVDVVRVSVAVGLAGAWGCGGCGVAAAAAADVRVCAVIVRGLKGIFELQIWWLDLGGSDG